MRRNVKQRWNNWWSTSHPALFINALFFLTIWVCCWAGISIQRKDWVWAGLFLLFVPLSFGMMWIEIKSYALQETRRFIKDLEAEIRKEDKHEKSKRKSKDS